MIKSKSYTLHTLLCFPCTQCFTIITTIITIILIPSSISSMGLFTIIIIFGQCDKHKSMYGRVSFLNVYKHSTSFPYTFNRTRVLLNVERDVLNGVQPSNTSSTSTFQEGRLAVCSQPWTLSVPPPLVG